MKRVALFVMAVLFVALMSASAGSDPGTTESAGLHDAIASKKERVDFMSYFVEFMRNPERQKNSVHYPISVSGKEVRASDAWTHIPFFSMTEYMPVLFYDDAEGFDSSIYDANIVMSIIHFDTPSFSDYSFTAGDSGWLLTKLENRPLEQHVDSDFLTFLISFSKDPGIQKQSILFPLPLKTFDDEYEIADRMVTGTEWEHQNLAETADNLVVLNIYERNTPIRRIYFRGIGCGISETFVFTRHDETWKLTRIESLSM